MSFRSPPAKKVFLAEAKITPLRSSSARSFAITSCIPGTNRAFIVLADWPAMSIVTVTMPSASLS